ncbi:MAG: hypothetical protein JO321_12100, partial [Solirubrobacterales bacterium]|nr:hypothetical protein [Solirubrobacterales bacterium]
MLIYWDQYFTDTPEAVISMDQFVSDLANGSYWDGLIQYGVGTASLHGDVVIDMKTYPTPNSQHPGQTFSEQQMQTQLIAWLDQDEVWPKPAGDEENLVYLIFAPSDTTLSLGGNVGGFCGYHYHGSYNATTSRDNLIWGIVSGYEKASTGQEFVNSVSYCVSHELSEAFSNPDGGGWFNDNGCEIGDICEAAAGGACCITVGYMGWQVEEYWSNLDGRCVSGPLPLSPGPPEGYFYGGHSKTQVAFPRAGNLVEVSVGTPMFLDRTDVGDGRVLIADFSTGGPPAQVKYWENWGQSPLLDGWEDDNDWCLVGDFMASGHDQVMFLNRTQVG